MTVLPRQQIQAADRVSAPPGSSAKSRAAGSSRTKKILHKHSTQSTCSHEKRTFWNIFRASFCTHFADSIVCAREVWLLPEPRTSESTRRLRKSPSLLGGVLGLRDFSPESPLLPAPGQRYKPACEKYCVFSVCQMCMWLLVELSALF